MFNSCFIRKFADVMDLFGSGACGGSGGDNADAVVV